MADKKKNKRNTDFFNKVYEVTKQIPYGKVTTYGHIAEAIGIKSAARTVGWALNGCGRDIPAHRVVNRVGALTGKFHFGDPEIMEALLVSEGVEFDQKGRVKLNDYLWVPPFYNKKKKKS